MARFWRIAAPLIALALLAAAQRPASQSEVDLELVLAVDVSMSMNADELAFQRQGYLEALSNPDIVEAMLTTGSGRVAITYMEWAGEEHAQFVVPWMLIDSRESARAFVKKLTAEDPVRVDRTSISNALIKAGAAFGDNEWQGLRRVIDISGDGPNNAGEHLPAARDRLVEEGITVNGLALQVEGAPLGLGIDYLEDYYRACVTGGSGSFVMSVRNWSQFSRALQLKLLQEITGLPRERPMLQRADYDPIKGIAPKSAKPVDCQIGEKIWNRFMRQYNAID